MGWGRIDDGFDEHAKVLALLDEEEPADAYAAITLWTLCFTWAHRNTRRRGKTPGLIPSGLPRRQLGPVGRDAAKVLVRHGLWDEHPEGWMIHDFAEYLPTEETKAARAEAGRRGAAKRWAHKHAAESAGYDEGQADSYLPSGDGNLPSGSDSVDDNGVANDGSRGRARRGTTGSTTDKPIPEPEPEKTPSESSRRASRAATKRGTRIPDDFTVTPEMVTWARENVPSVDGRRETEKFINYWRAKSGKDASKLDWPATWRNWMLNAAERSGARASPGPLPNGADLEAGWKGLRS